MHYFFCLPAVYDACLLIFQFNTILSWCFFPHITESKIKSFYLPYSVDIAFPRTLLSGSYSLLISLCFFIPLFGRERTYIYFFYCSFFLSPHRLPLLFRTQNPPNHVRITSVKRRKSSERNRSGCVEKSRNKN